MNLQAKKRREFMESYGYRIYKISDDMFCIADPFDDADGFFIKGPNADDLVIDTIEQNISPDDTPIGLLS